MTETLNNVSARKKPAEESAEQQAAAELVRLAKEQDLSLTGPEGLLMRTTTAFTVQIAGSYRPGRAQ